MNQYTTVWLMQPSIFLRGSGLWGYVSWVHRELSNAPVASSSCTRKLKPCTGGGRRNCLTGHKCKKPRHSRVELDLVGQGHCASGQIYASHAWELAPSSVGTKGFHTDIYKDWLQAAWAKCLAKNANTKFVSVWIDAGYRCYTGTTWNANGGWHTKSWAPVQMAALGQGHCASCQIYASHAWELAPSSVGTKGFHTDIYMDWLQAAWAKCLAKNANTKFVSVWVDAGYRCYTGTTCNPNGGRHTKSWAPVQMAAVGQGHCASGQIYASHAWELAPSSVGTKGFHTDIYKDWLQAAWAKCLAKNANTKFVSVWIDAGYRCYTGTTCNANGGRHTKSWAPVQMAAVGQGHCASGQIYASHAWELAPSSVGTKGFDTGIYMDWLQAAWAKCLAKNANTKFVSVWVDAGYRCYTGTTCNPNGGRHTKSWAPVS